MRDTRYGEEQRPLEEVNFKKILKEGFADLLGCVDIWLQWKYVKT